MQRMLQVYRLNHQRHVKDLYWIARYNREGVETTFDWFLKPSYLIPILEPYMSKGKESKILMLGCGNSTLGEEVSSGVLRTAQTIAESPLLARCMMLDTITS
jgi:hypothetical protein